MEELKLTVAKREVLGKRNRFLRRRGITPAHLFGHDLASLSLQCDTVELKKIVAHAGTTRLVSLEITGEEGLKSVFVREIQRDALGKNLLHVDFYQVRKGERMSADIPIVLVGEAPAMKGKGRLLSRGITELSIECVPEKVPPQIEVDISGLMDLEQAIHVRDIVLDPDITVHDDPEQMVVKVAEIVIKVEEEKPVVVEEAVAEGEEEAEAEEKPATEAAPARAEKPEKKEKIPSADSSHGLWSDNDYRFPHACAAAAG
jgi:large subunit ribosomal protein L25